MKKIVFAALLLVGCNSAPKVYKVEFNSGKMYIVESVGYYDLDSSIYFHGDNGMFPKDSVKSITVK